MKTMRLEFNNGNSEFVNNVEGFEVEDSVLTLEINTGDGGRGVIVYRLSEVKDYGYSDES